MEIGTEILKAWFTHGSGIVSGSNSQLSRSCLTEDVWFGGPYFKTSYEEAKISITIKVVNRIMDIATQILETNDCRR